MFASFRVLTLLLVCLTSWGCVTRSSISPENKAWAKNPNNNLVIEGRFSNFGKSSQDKVEAPTLSNLLFDNFLDGFEIDSVELTLIDEGNRLWIKPYVGKVLLKEQRTLDRESERDGEHIWIGKTPPEYIDRYIAAASVFSVGGAILPITSRRTYRLFLDDNGDLLIQLKEKDLVDFFFVIPISFSNELWLHYSLVEAPENPNAPEAAK